VKVTRRILLYDNSVILRAIGASLQGCSQFEVITLAPPLQEVQELEAINPDALLFDLETTHPEAVFQLLETNPPLLLIGISSDINLVKVWSGRELRELSLQDLLGVIKSELNNLVVESFIDGGRI